MRGRWCSFPVPVCWVASIEAFGLRALRQRQVYTAGVLLRAQQLGVDAGLLGIGQAASAVVGADASGAMAPEAWLEAARRTTERVLEVIRRRERGYRYHPLSRATAGGSDGTLDENWTTYSYRYLNRTHHAYYYRLIDERVASLLAGGPAVSLLDALLAPDEALTLQLAPGGDAVEVDFGDGDEARVAPDEGAIVTHRYDESGVYSVRARATTPEPAVEFDVCALNAEFATGFSGTVLAPPGAEIIEATLPNLVFGTLDSGRGVVGFSFGLGSGQNRKRSRRVARAG